MINYGLQSQTIFITGGASGIGKAAALLAAKDGARVVVADLDEAAAASVVEEIESSGGEAFAVAFDVRSQQVGETLYEVVLEMRCEAKIGENTAFLVELSYAGLFTVTGLAEEHIKPVLLIEAPRLLFPFARAIVADATRDGG